jgi:hypothetical protein
MVCCLLLLLLLLQLLLMARGFTRYGLMTGVFGAQGGASPSPLLAKFAGSMVDGSMDGFWWTAVTIAV